MAINEARLCVVCYDIADPKRLNRVHRYLRRLALPLQYSVFTTSLTPKKQQRLMQGLARIIDDREDDVRLYPLPSRLEHLSLGRQWIPDGVLLTEGGSGFVLRSFPQKSDLPANSSHHEARPRAGGS